MIVTKGLANAKAIFGLDQLKLALADMAKWQIFDQILQIHLESHESKWNILIYQIQYSGLKDAIKFFIQD